MNALVNNSLLTGDSEYEYEMPIYSNNGFNDINYYLNKKTDLPLYYLDDYVKNQASDIKKMHVGMLVTKLDSIYYSNMSIVEKAGLCRIERYFL